jgi:hypothetical protein
MGSLYLEVEKGVVLRNVCYAADIYAVQLPKILIKRKICDILEQSDTFLGHLWY